MSSSSTEQTALITGAASGIGAATARLLAPQRRGLMLHTQGKSDESRMRLKQVAEAARASGCQVETATGDLATEGAGYDLVRTALAKFGRLDQLVSNAGFADKRGVEVLTRADLDRSHAAMTGAFFEMAQAAAPALKTSPQGRIIFISSFVAHRFAQGALYPASAAAKAGAEALARTLAAELAPHGVTVNVIIPGYTRKEGGHTALSADAWAKAAHATPLGRIAEPDDIALLIAFLLSPAARHITGQAIAVDGGLSLG